MSGKSDRTVQVPITPSSEAIGADIARSERLWIAVLIFGFLGLTADGMDFMFLSFSLPSLMHDLGLSKVQAGSLASYSLLGMALGGIIGGWSADRYGRVRTMVWTIVVFSVGTAALGLARSYWQFAGIRLISSLGLGAMFGVCNTLMAEYVPTKRRTTILAALQAGWSVGYVAATVLAGSIIPVYGWRFLFATALAPVIIAVLLKRTVPEPPGWTEFAAKRAASGERTKAEGTKEESQWKTIFEDRGYRRMFILWTLTTGFLQFGNFGVNNWLPTYLVNELNYNFTSMTGYLVSTYTAMILGKIIAGYLADRLGRRLIYACGGLATAVCLPLIVSCHTPGNIVALLTAFGFVYGVPYAVLATYMTESFETRIRGTAVGVTYNVGRVGAAIAPTVIGLIATGYSIGLGLAVMGGAYFMTGIIPGLFIKEKLYDPQKTA